jgi:hypothetical protein
MRSTAQDDDPSMRWLAFPILAAAVWTAAPSRAEVEVLHEPKVRGMRLDWCLYWARGCGEPAASAYCRTLGFNGALRYSIDQNLGRKGVVTVVLGDGRLCGAATCSGFRSVTCERP